MAGQSLLGGVKKEFGSVRRCDKIIEKARDGCGQKSIGEMSVQGGEHRVYTSPWTHKPGNAGGGDAVHVRVKSVAQFGGQAAAVLSVGQAKVRFAVTTKQ